MSTVEFETNKGITKAEYQFKREVLGQSIDIKFPTMRKEKNFCIYPISSTDNFIYLQSDTQCCKIEISTGRTIFSNKGSCPMEYYLHFKPTAAFKVSLEFVQDVISTVRGDKRYNENTVCTDFSHS